MTRAFTLSPVTFSRRYTRTRFPFQYGIASMTEVPHLFLHGTITLADGRSSPGISAEGLPPKWFTKNPHTTFEEDLPDMLRVIGVSAKIGADLAVEPIGIFPWWRQMDRSVRAWAREHGVAPLLAGLGISLVERLVFDGFCRAVGLPLHDVLRENVAGIDLGQMHPALEGLLPRDFLPAQPLASVAIRHTVGLGDPLTAADIPAGEALADGLPHDLESVIQRYGVRWFKIKLSGKADHDRARLEKLAVLLEAATGGDYQATLDGNENFPSMSAFRGFWESCRQQPVLASLLEHVVLVEQPIHRDHCLVDQVALDFQEWKSAPPVIIDESDAAWGDLARALELGYSGVSHKNCKGVIKGLANAALVHVVSRQRPGLVITGEDLANIGPVALLQDLAMMAALGISHVERNGHHYFRGLDMHPPEIGEAMLRLHPDLYERAEENSVILKIGEGRIALDSVNQSPFGVGFLPDPAEAVVLPLS